VVERRLVARRAQAGSWGAGWQNVRAASRTNGELEEIAVLWSRWDKGPKPS
jgi:hypothetical protein